MKAPEGFAELARRRAMWLYREECNADLPPPLTRDEQDYAWRWRDAGEWLGSCGAIATWWLFLALLAEDGQEAPE